MDLFKINNKIQIQESIFLKKIIIFYFHEMCQDIFILKNG